MDRSAELRGRTDEMVDALRALVEVESPSSDIEANRRCADVVDDLAKRLLGMRAERIEAAGRVHLRWRFGSPSKVVLIGHIDTVWPIGTLLDWPFGVSDGHATGPGTFDMKAGVVQLLYALAVLEELDGVAVLLTTDEELGSQTSEEPIKETVAEAAAALVLEPSANGALKTERKGGSRYRIRITGRAAHAGLDPERGNNAGVELAHQILAIDALGSSDYSTTVTPTLANAGSSGNSVPDTAELEVDVRALTSEELDRIDRELRSLTGVVKGTSLEIELLGRTPPMPRSGSVDLFAHAQRIASELRIGQLEQASVGGGSDGNLIASLGVPTLDGLGAVGGGAHARSEHVVVSTMPERAALVAALVAELSSP